MKLLPRGLGIKLKLNLALERHAQWLPIALQGKDSASPVRIALELGQPALQLANRRLRELLLQFKLNQAMELLAQLRPIVKPGRASVWQTRTVLELGQLAPPPVKQLLRGLSLLLKLSPELELPVQLRLTAKLVKVSASLTRTVKEHGLGALINVNKQLQGHSLRLSLSQVLESSVQLLRIVPQVRATAKLRPTRLTTSDLEQSAPKRRNSSKCTTKLELIPNGSCSS